VKITHVVRIIGVFNEVSERFIGIEGYMVAHGFKGAGFGGIFRWEIWGLGVDS
jgi:hypothetical protein